MDNVISNIKAFRKARGMTQAELGAKVGVAGATITRYERQQLTPDVYMLIKIYKALGIKLTLTYKAELTSLGFKYETEDKTNVST